MPIAHREIELDVGVEGEGGSSRSMSNPDESISASGPNPPATAAVAAVSNKAGEDTADDASSSDGSLPELRQELSSTHLPVPRFQLRRQPSGACI